MRLRLRASGRVATECGARTSVIDPLDGAGARQGQALSVGSMEKLMAVEGCGSGKEGTFGEEVT